MPDMPKFEKPAPELVAAFGVAVDRAGRADVTQKPMFGHPCAWIGGNMARRLIGGDPFKQPAPADEKAIEGACPGSSVQLRPI